MPFVTQLTVRLHLTAVLKPALVLLLTNQWTAAAREERKKEKGVAEKERLRKRKLLEGAVFFNIDNQRGSRRQR